MIEISVVDTDALFDPRTYKTGVPYDLIAEMRQESPIHWVEEPALLGWGKGPGFWAVLTHDLVNKVLRDPNNFSSYQGGTQIRDPSSASMLSFVQRMMLNQDPPEHSRLRRLLVKSFTPRAVARLEENIKSCAFSIVANVQKNGRADFVTEIATDLPLLTLASIMGIPEEDRMLLYDWSNRVIGYQDAEYAASDSFDPKKGTEMAKRALKIRADIKVDESGRLPDPRSREGLADMYSYASDLANYRLSNPGEDIVSILLNADDDQGQITVEEFETMFFLFAVAGNETLRNGIPGGLLALLTHPEQLTQLVNDPSLLDGAIEEMLRYAPPVVHFRRTATCDLELGGRSVEAGEKIVVYHAAANRDPKVFENPDQFDILRSPNDHLTFGAGPHFCLGSRLARVQMRALFHEIITKLPNLEIAGEPEHLVSNFQNGLKHLPIRWST